MKVSMADVNKKANQIINRVAESGETAIIMKHGKPIAEIRPISPSGVKEEALAYLMTVEAVDVKRPIEKVLASGRRRGI